MEKENLYELTMPRPAQDGKPEYNSTHQTLRLPEYGRLVQEMVDYALTISDRAERQRYAEAIVSVMLGLNPKMKNEPDFQHKIWDHLALLADYELDIDYPFEVTRLDGENKKPVHLGYPKSQIRFRHYGHLVEKALAQLADMPESAERERFTRLVASRMKRNLADWKGDGVQDDKVARDIAFYTEGRVQPDFSAPGKQLLQINDNRFRTRKNKSAN